MQRLDIGCDDLGVACTDDRLGGDPGPSVPPCLRLRHSSMTELTQWDAVDRYIEAVFLGHDDVLEEALRASDRAGLPAIQVTPSQGKMLNLLARACSARRILEIGTLGGYSTIWLGRALPQDGQLLSLELNPKHAEVARANIELAGLSDKVEVRLGPAKDTLTQLKMEAVAPFDFIFIDADKPLTADYFSGALAITRIGSVIVVDNVVRGGKVADLTVNDPDAEGIRQFHERIANEVRVSATEIQTVSSKGYDGFALALVLGVS